MRTTNNFKLTIQKTLYNVVHYKVNATLVCGQFISCSSVKVAAYVRFIRSLLHNLPAKFFLYTLWCLSGATFLPIHLLGYLLHNFICLLTYTPHTHTTHTHIFISVCVCVSVISLANPCPAWWWWPCQRWLFTNCIFTSYFIAAAATCRKEQVREYYTENDCRSRQPLKYAKCVGGCGNQCCAAKIVRRRKVSN